MLFLIQDNENNDIQIICTLLFSPPRLSSHKPSSDKLIKAALLPPSSSFTSIKVFQSLVSSFLLLNIISALSDSKE